MILDRSALWALVILTVLTALGALYGLYGLVLGDSWLRPLLTLLISGVMSGGFAFGAWQVNGQLQNSPLPNAGVERDLLSRLQRRRLSKARASALYQRAMDEVDQERDRLTKMQLERGTDV